MLLICIFSDLENNPEYLRMISSAEETAQRRRSAEPPQQTTEASFRDGLEDNEFLDKVCKFELISRGKATQAKSPTGKGSTKLNISAPDARSGRRSGENFHNFVGEKLFTKDTATTRVSASILQSPVVSPKPDVNSLDTSSIGSYGSISRRKSSESRNSRSSTKSTDSSSPAIAVSSPCPSQGTPNVFSSGSVSPVKKTELQAAQYFGSPRSPGGLISPGVSTLKKFPTEPKTDIPTLERPKPVIAAKPQISAPLVTVETVNSASSNNNVKVQSGNLQKSPNKVATKDFLNVNNGDVVVSRNTFEGIDFDFNELTESQKDLTLKHREVVAERKQEQEMERLERLRLEEILNMCADYERQIEDEHKHVGKKFYESSNTTAEWATPPIPPLPLQYQHLQNNNHHGNQMPRSPRTSQEQVHKQGQGQFHGQFRTTAPPTGLDFDSHSMDRKEFGMKTDHRSSMTNKIMTNGSLTMLSSPTNTHKDFFHGYQMRKCGSNSSNSEEESFCGSSEDTGTIKRRPNSNQGPLDMDRPKSPRTLPRSFPHNQINRFNNQSMAMSQADQSHSTLHRTSSPLCSKNNEAPPAPVQSATQIKLNNSGEFNNSFKIEPLRLTNVSVEFIERKQLDNSLEAGSHNSMHSEPECDLQLKQGQGCELQINESSISSRSQVNTMTKYPSNGAVVQQGNKTHEENFGGRNSEPESIYSVSANYRPGHRSRNTDHHDYVNIPVNGAQYSDSSSASSSTTSTVCAPTYHGFINNILTTGSPRSSGSMSGSKSSSIENVTPMNSDNEFNTVVARRQGSRTSSTATTDSSECSIGTIDVSCF